MASPRVGIVGAGTMGAGIAEVAARAGCEVRLHDAVPAALERARERIRRSLATAVERGRLPEGEAAAALDRIRPAQHLEELTDCALVIEAVPEDLALKREIFRRLDALCPPPALLATNTSSLSVTALAAATGAPERVVGLHFFNPAPVMPLVEVVAGLRTDPAAADEAEAWALRFGKVPLRVPDVAGFLVNRVARPFYGEALRLLGEGVADVATIDRAVRAAGFPLGPFELMDLIGIDVNLAVTRSVYEASFYEPRYRPHPIQQRLVAAGLLGRKTGQGFYAYDPEGRCVGVAVGPRGLQARPPGPLRAERPEARPVARVAVLGATRLAAALREALAARGVLPAAEPGPDLELVVDGGLSDAELARVEARLPARVALAVQILDRPLGARAWRPQPGRPAFGFAVLPPFHPGGALEWTPWSGDGPGAWAGGLAAALGLEPVQVADSPGGVVPRLVAQLINEACFARDDGLADEETIDRALELGMRHPRGPFAWLAAAGPSLVLRVVSGLAAWFGEERYRPAPGLRRAAARADGAEGEPGP